MIINTEKIINAKDTNKRLKKEPTNLKRNWIFKKKKVTQYFHVKLLSYSWSFWKNHLLHQTDGVSKETGLLTQN